MVSSKIIVVFLLWLVLTVAAHGPLRDQDREDISMGRQVKRPGKMGGKWCSLARTCVHDRAPVCGINHAGEIMGFRDLCDMNDFNCLRKRNYRQTSCPEDKTLLTASRRPVNSYYDD